MVHKHHYRLKFVGDYSYSFVCVCGIQARIKKHRFRMMCRGWNPYKEN